MFKDVRQGSAEVQVRFGQGSAPGQIDLGRVVALRQTQR